MRELQEEANVSLNATICIRLRPVTPEIEIRRYDTRFSPGADAEGQTRKARRGETTALEWLAAR